MVEKNSYVIVDILKNTSLLIKLQTTCNTNLVETKNLREGLLINENTALHKVTNTLITLESVKRIRTKHEFIRISTDLATYLFFSLVHKHFNVGSRVIELISTTIVSGKIENVTGLVLSGILDFGGYLYLPALH